ncbi:hypothetical protein [Haloplanus halobius]|uniref:hypothetical protein n=1 Tax=Haloplanus halobius TaxID=2934938 RepID=UPI00200E02BF|nr:hypothetical protein [Haloplanus sp. XH21]
MSDDAGADGAVPKDDLPAEIVENVPYWESDPYLDRVSDRLMYNYDLEKDHAAAGERWDLYGEMRVLSQKQFFHPALSYADHEAEEYLFVKRVAEPTVAELERLVEVGHDVADERVTPDEEHYRTDVTFVAVSETVPDAVADYVDGFRDRTLLTFGYHGHYELNLVVVAPEAETLIASEAADIADAFALWAAVERESPGLLSRIARRFWR